MLAVALAHGLSNLTWSVDDERLFWQKKVFVTSSASQLLDTVFHYMGKLFGLHLDEQKHLAVGQISRELDSDGYYVRYRSGNRISRSKDNKTKLLLMHSICVRNHPCRGEVTQRKAQTTYHLCSSGLPVHCKSARLDASASCRFALQGPERRLGHDSSLN